ncbi:hypothetical protein [Streptomyces sp. NPDC003077]|uniref:DUF7544 domain-containing protein n=1 Tax=Streptomyces sp. NPDC003077 TaxID=3154443 RepID=UPI0033B9A36B
MTNSPGWTSPGSTPSDEPDRGTQPTPPTNPADGHVPPQWTPPPAGAAGPYPGGPGGGWQGPPPGYTWGPPPAVKPGVIPLRPLGVGEILDGAVSTMRAHWRTVLGISLVVAVVSQVVATLVTVLWGPKIKPPTAAQDDPRQAMRESLDAMSDVLKSSGVSAVIWLIGTVLVTALLTVVVSRAVLGRSVTIGEAWRDSRGQLPRLGGLLLLLPLLCTLIMAVGVTPGIIVTATSSKIAGVVLAFVGLLGASAVAIWVWVRYSLAAPALMLEKQGILTAMRRSDKLVRGSWWRVMGIQLLASVLVGVLQFIVEIPATLIALLAGGESMGDWVNSGAATPSTAFLVSLGVGTVISTTIGFPISAGVTALLYMDQRIRREALDLELARAAGVPGYAPEGPDGTGATMDGTGPRPHDADPRN